MKNEKEALFEAMIKIAGQEVMEEDAQTYPSGDALDMAFSPEFEKKMQRLLRQTRPKPGKNRLRIKGFFRVAAACIAILTIAVTGAFAFVPAFREGAINVIADWGEQRETPYTIIFPRAQNQPSMGENNLPGYIPEGFFEVDYFKGETQLQVIYANEAHQEIWFWKHPLDGTNFGLMEGFEYSERIINGFTAHVFTAKNNRYYSHVVFCDDYFFYDLNGNVPVSELILMAESLPVGVQE